MKDLVTVDLLQFSPHLYRAIVKIPVEIINRFVHNAIDRMTRKNIQGLSKVGTPADYIKQNFTQNIVNHMKEFFFKYFVLSRLYKEVRAKKIVMLGEPRLVDCFLAIDKDAEYHLEFNTIYMPITRDWKYISFKSTQRKKYKDIDKQASEFLKEEEEKEKQHKDSGIEIGDWVNFSVAVIDINNAKLFDVDESLWIKIGQDDSTLPFQEVFIGKKIGDQFYSDHFSIQEFFNTENNIPHHFLITIIGRAPQGYFSIENFKKHFKIKTHKKAHEKIVEVFSYSNDMSLRRNITNEAFETLLKTYPIDIPEQCVLRQQQAILSALQDNPDYIVYRTEPGFNDRVKKLAEQQLKEVALIELLAHSEDLEASDEDTMLYLNLAQRPRTRELIHFIHPEIAYASEIPIHTESLKQSCLREKALNHAILYLTKV